MNKIEAQMLAGEMAGGQTTTEYVIVVAIVLGLAAALFLFRNQLGQGIKDAGNSVKNLFTNLSSNY